MQDEGEQEVAHQEVHKGEDSHESVSCSWLLMEIVIEYLPCEHIQAGNLLPQLQLMSVMSLKSWCSDQIASISFLTLSFI